MWRVSSSYEGALNQRNLEDFLSRIQLSQWEEVPAENPTELETAVAEGRIDAAYTGMGYDATQPGMQLLTAIPFGPSGLYLYEFVEAYGNEYLAEYGRERNLVYLPFCLLPAEMAGWTKVEYTDLSWFKGKNVRAYGLYGSFLEEELGANLLTLAASEIIPRADELDYVEYSNYQIDLALGINRYFNYVYTPTISQPATILYLVLNRERWNQLDEAAREEIITTSQTVAVTNYSFYAIGQREAFSTEQRDVEKIALSPTLVNQTRSRWLNYVEKLRQRDDRFNQLWQNYLVFMKEYQPLVDFTPVGWKPTLKNVLQKSSSWWWFCLLLVLILLIFIWLAK